MIIKKLKFALVLLFTFAFDARSSSLDDSIFWEANRDGKLVYVLGALHVGFEPQYPVREDIISALRKSSVYVTETFLPFLRAEDVKTALKEAYGARSGRTLNELLETSQCGKLIRKEQFTNQLGLVYGTDVVRKFLDLSPRALIHILYSNGLTLNASNLNGLIKLAPPMEAYLRKQAGDLKTKIESLDPEFWESIDLLTTDESCSLLSGLIGLSTSVKQNQELRINELVVAINYWSTGNSAELEKLHFRTSEAYSSEYAKAHHKWFDLRNRNMAEKILRISTRESGPIFISVGAAHLAGNSGILSLLREAGFTVQTK